MTARASRVQSAASLEAFRAVVVASFFVVVMPRPDSPERRVGRFGFGFLGALVLETHPLPLHRYYPPPYSQQVYF